MGLTGIPLLVVKDFHIPVRQTLIIATLNFIFSGLFINGDGERFFFRRFKRGGFRVVIT